MTAFVVSPNSNFSTPHLYTPSAPSTPSIPSPSSTPPPSFTGTCRPPCPSPWRATSPTLTSSTPPASSTATCRTTLMSTTCVTYVIRLNGGSVVLGGGGARFLHISPYLSISLRLSISARTPAMKNPCDEQHFGVHQLDERPLECNIKFVSSP